MKFEEDWEEFPGLQVTGTSSWKKLVGQSKETKEKC